MEIDVYKEWLGIPEGDRPPDHYQLLRLVQFEDAADKIQAHYRKLNAHVRKYASGKYSIQSQDLLTEMAKAMLCLTDPDRKRDYDESLGREFEEQLDAFGQRAFDAILIENGQISREQAKELDNFAEARGLSMRDAAVQMKLVDAEKAAQTLAQMLRLPFVDLKEMIPDDSVLDKVPRHLVKRHTFLPLFEDDDVVLLACIDQLEHELLDELRLRFDMPVREVIATPLAINQAIAMYYAPGRRDESVTESYSPSKTKSKKSDKKKAAKPTRKKKSQMDQGEQSQQKLIGILIICWTLSASAIIDTYVIRGFLLPTSYTWPFYLTLVTGPAAIWFTWQNYFKK